MRDEYEVRRELNRRRVLQGMLATAGAAALGSGVSSWVTQGAARAAGALLGPGTRPFPSKPEGTDMLPKIEHIVIYMQENHSFDNYFGTFPGVDGFTLDGGGQPTNTNDTSGGTPITAFHQTDTCNVITGDHGWSGTHRSWNDGAMDGFVKASGAKVMGYYEDTELPFYWGLAETFPICDRWFSSVLGPTHPNRRYLLAGTSAGLTVTDVNAVLAHPVAPNGTIFDRLDDLGITWKDYAIDLWDVLLYPGSDPGSFIADHKPHLKGYADFLADCYAGTLPQVSILAPGVQGQYDEGAHDVHNGEAYSSAIINAVLYSPVWEKTALFFTYDEHGGGYDHVPPPAAVLPDNIAPILSPGDVPGAFDRYGIRVPGFVVSPYAKKDYVSHVVHDHTSILKFIETKWNIGALTHRDANADDLLDCFDFSKMAFGDPPVLPDPGIPATGSPCEPQPLPATNPHVTPTTTTTSTPTSSTTTTAPSGVNSGGAVAVPGSPTFTG